MMARETRTERERHAVHVLRDAVRCYRGKIVLACSFGGPSGMVLLDMLARIDASVPVYYLDTNLLFPQTYELVARVRERYGIEPIAVMPALSVEAQNAAYGEALWSRDPDACCDLRKVEPQHAFLASYEAWITGIRRGGTATRAQTPFEERDECGRAKIAPLADWNDADIWSYVTRNDVPYNPLNDAGYPSVGCTHCTRAIAPGEDARAGRWSGFAKTECGIHKDSEMDIDIDIHLEKGT